MGKGPGLKTKKVICEEKIGKLSEAELEVELRERLLGALNETIISWRLSVRDEYVKKGYSHKEVDRVITNVLINFEVR